MEALISLASATTLWPPPLLRNINQKPIFSSCKLIGGFQPLSCLRKNGDGNGLQKADSQLGLEGDDSSIQISEKLDKSDIWKLFREAQQNILYLNKQRLVALEEAKKTNQEKMSLLKKIEKLESEKQLGAGKDNQSICWELLLRIDSMVFAGIVTTEEASVLRKFVMNHKVSVADAFHDITTQRDAELLAELRLFTGQSNKSGLHIIQICTEMEPLISVRSLASYVTGLSQALQRKGHSVEVILPRYANLDLSEVQGLRQVSAECYSYFNGQLHTNRIWTGVVHGIGVTFIEPIYYTSLFNRERIYGYSDDFERFMYFSRASLDYIVKCGKQPDVLHVHNWETAIVGPLLWDIFVKQGLGGTKILLTCHDLKSQCLEQPEKLALCGLNPARLDKPDRFQDDYKTHLLNILKGGIVYSNKVVLMSSTQSKSKIIHSLGHGLEPTLSKHMDKLVLSPYGFDKVLWDPSKDHVLPNNYSAEDMKGKDVCKVALMQRLAFPKHTLCIIVGCIFSEMTDVDIKLLKEVVWSATSRNHVQFVFMGISKNSSVNAVRESFEKEMMEESIRFIMEPDEALTHLVFAGSDIILCKPFHDPVLSVPLKALRYGAAPIAINPDVNTFRHFVEHGYETTKYSQFINSTFGSMSLGLALDEIMNNPDKWKRRIKDAMAQDFSWDGECCDIHVSAYNFIRSLN